MARWALVSDLHIHSKADRLLEVAKRLAARGVRVGGFVQRQRTDANGRHVSEVEHVSAGDVAALGISGITPRPGQDGYCTHAFDPQGFATARRWVETDAGSGCALLVVDGISQLEAGGAGHAAALQAALDLPGDRVVLVGAHARHMFNLVERFAGLGDDPVAQLELPADAAAVRGFEEALVRALVRS